MTGYTWLHQKVSLLPVIGTMPDIIAVLIAPLTLTQDLRREPWSNPSF